MAHAYAAVVGVYLLRFVDVRPLQVPAYLLLLGYDLVEGAVPAVTPYHPVAFPVFLYFLGVLGAATSRVVASGGREEGTVLDQVGGVLLVTGTLSVVVGASIGGRLLAPSDNPTPLAITLATGAVLLAVGWFLFAVPAPSRIEDR